MGCVLWLLRKQLSLWGHWTLIRISRFILQLVKYTGVKGECQVLRQLIQNWLVDESWNQLFTPEIVVCQHLFTGSFGFWNRSERKHCWNHQTLGTSRITHLKWQHWIILLRWKVIFLSLPMMETWLKLLKATAGIFLSDSFFFSVHVL